MQGFSSFGCIPTFISGQTWTAIDSPTASVCDVRICDVPVLYKKCQSRRKSNLWSWQPFVPSKHIGKLPILRDSHHSIDRDWYAHYKDSLMDHILPWHMCSTQEFLTTSKLRVFRDNSSEWPTFTLINRPQIDTEWHQVSFHLVLMCVFPSPLVTLLIIHQNTS